MSKPKKAPRRKPQRNARPSRTKDVAPAGEPPALVSSDESTPFAGGYRFARLLVWDFSYYVDVEAVTIQLVHVSHMKADVPLRERDAQREWVEQLPGPMPSLRMPQPVRESQTDQLPAGNQVCFVV